MTRIKRKPRIVSDDDIAEMRQLRHSGVSQTDIGKRFGVSRRTVQYWTCEKVREKSKDYMSGYHAARREAFSKSAAAYYAENSERCRRNSRAYYAANRERILKGKREKRLRQKAGGDCN